MTRNKYTTPYQLGYAAYNDGDPKHSSPYSAITSPKNWRNWRKGYTEAVRANHTRKRIKRGIK